MKIITIYFSLILFFTFSFGIAHATPWVGGGGYGCTYSSAEWMNSSSPPAFNSYSKIQGINTLCIAQSLQVFHSDNGNAITSQEACPANPSRWKSETLLPALPVKSNICYNCNDLITYDGTQTQWAGSTTCTAASPPGCVSTSWGDAYAAQYVRVCTDISPWNHTIINGNTLYTPTWPWYTKNAACHPSNPTSPDTALKVYQLKSETYMWDAVPPTCERWGYFNLVNRTDYIPDEDLTGILLDMKNNSKDMTLSFIDNNNVYTGSWTNRDIRWKGICSDPDSGCPMPNDPFFSQPLNHLQKRFPKVLKDMVDNSTNAQCDSTALNPIAIKRSCYYNLKSGHIDLFMTMNPFISITESTKLLEIQNRIKMVDATNFVQDVRSLYEIAKLADPMNPHILYELVPNSCNYRLQFDTNPGIPPLIDKINPTIGVTAKFGDGVAIPDVLLEQEGTPVVWAPLTRFIWSFLAGSGRITINLTDSWGSSFTDPGIWNNYNGISGMSELFVNVCQTKTFSWAVLNTDCSNPTNSIIYQIALITSTPYNATGALFDPNVWTIDIDLDDISGIQKAGEYQVYIAVQDQAGNLNTDSAAFNIIPEWFDPDRTELIKYNDPISEAFSNTLYTKRPWVSLPGLATKVSTYANAIDTLAYKINIFDHYGNPIYDWKLYNFELTQTGIYLDQVNESGPSALFIEPIGGILSNVSQMATTDMNGSLKFKILSYTPGEFLEQFRFIYKNWDRWRNETWWLHGHTFPSMVTDADKWIFNHILTGAIELHTTNRIDLGTSNDVRLGFFATSTVPIPSLSLFKVNNFLESIKSLDPDNFTITSTGSYNHFFNFSTHYPDPSYFFGAIGAFTPEQKGTIFSKKLEIISYPYLILTLSGLTTQYYASNTEDIFGSWLIYSSGSLNRIFIEWLTSMVGKNGYVATKDNLNFNSADTRNAVYKNVAVLLRNREVSSGWWIINRVKYLVWDVKSTNLTDMDQWDTLIIKGGNFFIGDEYPLTDTDFDARNYFFNSGSTWLEDVPHKWIIVIKDENNIGGNIFIKPDVRFIGAILFADESIESVKYNGTTFSTSNSARTVILNKQLVIYGSVFSKNTVGGAVRANNNGWYVLPWKNATVLLDDAVRYDLAFLRMDNIGSDTAGSMNRGHNEYVVILTDPRNISNNLPGFTKK